MFNLKKISLFFITIILIFSFPKYIFADSIIKYSAHVQSYGWMDDVLDGEVSGTVGQKKRLEAYQIEKITTSFTGDIYYKTYVEGIGWQDYVSSGNISGTVGQSKKIEMMQMKLTDELSEQYDIYYRVHVAHIGWMDWTCNDQITGTFGYGYQIEAIQIKLIRKGDNVPNNTKDIYREKPLQLQYSTHVQSYGWMDDVLDGEVSGTVGQKKRLEAYQIEKITTSFTGDIYYKTYVEGIGWQDYVSSGNISGTVGQSKKIEMMQMKLTDELSEQYDIYYRVHVAHIGWMDWTCNDQITGTFGYGYQIEAIQINLIKKGDSVPNNTKDIYKENNLSVQYQSYFKNNWQGIKKDGDISGTVGEKTAINGFKIDFNNENINNWISYRSYINHSGWQNYVSGGEISGSSTNNQKIEMIQVKLSAEISQIYDIYYRVHVSKIGWLDWACNDQITGTLGYGYQIEAIQIKILKKNESFNESTINIYKEKENYLTYSTHMQSYGWLNDVYENEISGLEQYGKRLEAIKVNINNKTVNGSIKYSVHVQSYGWQDYVADGNIAGTVGEYKRIEAIKMELTDQLSELYDIYYRTYVENFGWLDWAKNGDIAGSISLSKRMEAIQIMLVDKGESAPGSTEQSYIDSMFRVIDGKTYYYSNGNIVTGFKEINGLKYFFNSNGVLISNNVRKVIDVSSHQGKIDWTSVKRDAVDGAIIRLGYGTSYSTDVCVEDRNFATNYYATRDLNLLSGIYLYSYAINQLSAKLEAEFVLNRLEYYGVNKKIPIYYDLESNNWTKNLSSSDYDKIVTTFANILSKNGYIVKVYSYKYMAENKFSAFVREKLDWIAQYSDYCTYNGNYTGWQYTDNGTIAGISGKVDVNVWLR